jgi:phosphotransferase system enzyme I (PtsI)
VKNQILKSHLPDIIPLTQKIMKMDQPEKMAALLAKLND